jgi:integrase
MPGREHLGNSGGPGWHISSNGVSPSSRIGGAVTAIGAPGLHFHDLRHTGNTLAAAGSAGLRDLMDRMGHDSVRAALRSRYSPIAK